MRTRLGLAAAVALGSAGPASAEQSTAEQSAAARLLVVESAVRPSAPESQALARLGDALSQVDVAPLRRAWRSPGPLDDSERAALEASFDRALATWQDADFKTAIDLLERALASARERPETLGRSIAMREQALIAATALALAYKRVGDTAGARRAMKKLAIDFSRDRIPENRFGPEPVALRADVEAGLERARSLAIEVVGGGETTIYVNEHPVGRTAATFSRPFAGDYRVFVTGRGGSSRIHTVSLGPGEVAALRIDVGFESSVVFAPRLRLRFPDAAARQKHERDYAARLGRLAGAERVAIIAARGEELSATVLATSGEVVAELEAPLDRVDDLARWVVAGRKASAPIDSTAPSRDESGLLESRSMLWATTGVGVASVGLGIAYFAAHRPEVSGGARQAQARDTFTHGVVATSVGVVLVATATVLWWRRSRRERSTSVAVSPLRGGASLSIAGWF